MSSLLLFNGCQIEYVHIRSVSLVLQVKFHHCSVHLTQMLKCVVLLIIHWEIRDGLERLTPMVNNSAVLANYTYESK